jgi:uncharacterized protein YjbI with pentapeptide repeats
VLQIAAVFALMALAASARADIFQWEYIFPSEPFKRQSTTLAPDGAGVDAVPDADLSFLDLTMAYLPGADLTGANLNSSTLTSADLSGANLPGADLSSSTLTNADLNGANLADADLRSSTLTSAYLDGSILTSADLSGAVVAGASFGATTGFTKAQLYSTASYQEKNLQGIGLGYNDLTGWDFAEQNLADANLASTLTNADLSGALVTGAYFADTTSRGFTKEQLYSTASYQEKNLQGIGLGYNDLTGWDFAEQNLADARPERGLGDWGLFRGHNLPRLYQRATLFHGKLS